MHAPNRPRVCPSRRQYAHHEISPDVSVPAVTGGDSAVDGGGIGVFGTSAKEFGVKGSAEGTGA